MSGNEKKNENHKNNDYTVYKNHFFSKSFNTEKMNTNNGYQSTDKKRGKFESTDHRRAVVEQRTVRSGSINESNDFGSWLCFMVIFFVEM